jgi:hypothetical protein
MKSGYLITLLILAAPGVVLAQDAGKFKCTYGDMVRRVEILTEPGVTVPCEVHYYKDTENPGEKQVLWSAQAQTGYCEEKTEAFVAQLEGWGWDCGRAAAPAAEPEATAEEPAEEEVQDDTDVLAPGNL